MKYIPLQGQLYDLYEVHTLTGTPLQIVWSTYPYRDTPANCMKYIPLQGHPCKLYEVHTLTGTPLQIVWSTYPYRDTPANCMKYIPLQGHPCKLYEVHTLTGTPLQIVWSTYPYRDTPANCMKYIFVVSDGFKNEVVDKCKEGRWLGKCSRAVVAPAEPQLLSAYISKSTGATPILITLFFYCKHRCSCQSSLCNQYFYFL